MTTYADMTAAELNQLIAETNEQVALLDQWKADAEAAGNAVAVDMYTKVAAGLRRDLANMTAARLAA